MYCSLAYLLNPRLCCWCCIHTSGVSVEIDEIFIYRYIDILYILVFIWQRQIDVQYSLICFLLRMQLVADEDEMQLYSIHQSQVRNKHRWRFQYERSEIILLHYKHTIKMNQMTSLNSE